MALVGSLVIGISANLEGLKKGMASTRSELKGLKSSFRDVSMMMKGFGAISLGKQLIGGVASLAGHVDDLKKKAEETGMSVEQLSSGMMTALDVQRVQEMSSAFEHLGDTIMSAGASLLSLGAEGGATEWADGLSASIANLKKTASDGHWSMAGGLFGMLMFGSGDMNSEKVKGDRWAEAQGKRMKQAEKDAQKVLEAEKKRRQDMLKGQTDQIIENEFGKDFLERQKFSETGASQEEQETFALRQGMIREQERIKEEAHQREKERIQREKDWTEKAARAKEKLEREAEAAREKNLDRAASLMEGIRTPQEKYRDTLLEIMELEFGGFLTPADAARLQASEQADTLKELMGDTSSREIKTVGAVGAGSSEAFSAINRFKLGQSADAGAKKNREQQLQTLKAIEKKIGREPAAAVVESF